MRVRVTFSKAGPLAYTSHLDLMRVWERSLRRGSIPLAYSQGFNPRPKLQLAAALPLGHTAEGELLDVWLERGMSLEAFARALVSAMPDGLAVDQVRQVALNEPALQTRVVSAEYHVTVEGWGEGREAVTARIDRLLAADEIVYERRGRTRNLRPLVERLWVDDTKPVDGVGTGTTLGMQLAAREGATARPEDVLEALGMGEAFARYHRCRLLLRENGGDGER